MPRSPALVRRAITSALSSLVVAASVAWAPVQASVVTESGDAGQTQGSAQVTTALAGSLTSIFGSFGSNIDADLYLIRIFNPAAFTATTLNATGGGLDTQLFLLTLAGAPVYFNDDDAGGLSTLSTLPAGNPYGPLAAGLYILGVSNWGYDPVNSNNDLLFAAGLPTETRGPAFGLSPGVLGGFSDDTFGFGSAGAYQIQLAGAAAAVELPEPTTGVLVATAGALCAFATRRRRPTASPAVTA